MKNWRVNAIFCFIVLFGAAIISRLLYLQVIKNDYYKAMAQGQQKEFRILKGDRGRIFLRGGEILATNIKEKCVFVLPQKIENKEETAKTISAALNLDEKEVLEKIESDNLLELLKTDITEEEEKSVGKIKLAGVSVEEMVFRRYPQASMASQVVGFLGGEGTGQYGIEGYYDDILQGNERYENVEKSSFKYFFGSIDEMSNKGSDIFLTIDYNIQFQAERLLEKAKEDLDIEGGLITVIEPSSGKIFALANFPNFDPNDYSKADDFQIFQNSAIQRFYEPGSVFKPITMASALNEGKITPQTTYIDKGVLSIGGYNIYNFAKRTYGEKTMTEVLENSINTGAVFAERQLGNELFLDYLTKFGFFDPTGIDLQGEVSSENREFKKGYEVNFATASYGQGIQITPIQLVRAFCAIANGGKLVRPYIVEKVSKEGKVIETKPELSEHSVISSKTVSQLTAMMVSVIEKGFSQKAKIPHYYIAGKTGTSQVSFSSLDIDKKGYSDKTWQSFIGFAPAFDARFLILIKLDNPKASTAEYSAVPIFHELARYIINYLEIPPDYGD